MSKHSWNDLHIIRSWKFILKSIYITIGVFIFLFVLFHVGGALYISSIETKSVDAFHDGITKDLAYLKEQGDAVAENDLLQEYLLARDSEKLIELTKKEIAERRIGLMGVMDINGIALSRTLSVGNLGNNNFLVNPVGRIVAQGKSAQSVEATVGFDPRQIFLNTGRPIIRDGQMIGALAANYLTDDAYAIRFRNIYLSDGVEVVFYNKNAGVYGSSFSDGETRKLINSYFNSNSDWIKKGSSGKTISFDGVGYYLVTNIVFPGLESSPGGALVFIPRKDFSNTTNIVIALLTLCTFISLAIRYHMHSRDEEYGWRYCTLLIIASILVFVLSLIAFDIKKIGYLKLERIPFSIVVDTGDEAINIVQVKLVFDPKAIDMKALEVESSTCSYVIEKTIDSTLGEASLVCALFKSGGERGSLKIADVVVMPRHTGTFTLSFDNKNTKVLASDGLGTDVLRMTQAGSYRVDNFNPNLLVAATTTDNNRSFVVFSTTHPNQSRWYNSSTARFVWQGKPDAVYIYAFDSLPDTIPSKTHATSKSAVDISIPGDGIFYFHLQLAGGGPIAHYRLQSDQSPPSIVSINLSSVRIVEGDVVRFTFEAEDIGSGIQQNYYVDLGNNLFLPIGSHLFIPFLELGDQKIILRVYDSAGNYSEKSQIIHVESK